jgi:chromosome segregation ATPase
MTNDDERKAITEATQRLLAGKPLRSSGRLDIVTLAEEAGLKRNKLTHKHTDLKDLFNAERRARGGIPDSELRLRDEIAALTKKIKALREERDQYRTASETFARAINVLTIENDNLRQDIEKRRSSSVTSLPSRR